MNILRPKLFVRFLITLVFGGVIALYYSIYPVLDLSYMPKRIFVIFALIVLFIIWFRIWKRICLDSCIKIDSACLEIKTARDPSSYGPRPSVVIGLRFKNAALPIQDIQSIYLHYSKVPNVPGYELRKGALFQYVGSGQLVMEIKKKDGSMVSFPMYIFSTKKLKAFLVAHLSLVDLKIEV